ncbi:MAG TPA: 3-carboxy-cis,cis-muconate cycloisomerase [Pusillimonas sp.]|nr:3-carboxy-cis,cis-muconate cycloisomerase [Pusillimonas sp.]HCN72733.1 3-carboxy-cis,cis-muconate cycloisomerase [Pusillimonas sp.]
MSLPLFESFLTTTEMSDVFDDVNVVQAMLDFEAALAQAQAQEGLISNETATIITAHCTAENFNIPELVVAARRAGSMAIPLVKALTQAVASQNKEAATKVHWGSTSQDVIDTGSVLVTRQALQVIDNDLAPLCARLLDLAEAHIQTPVLARTLMQPAQTTTLGFKMVNWAAPLVRSRQALIDLADMSLQVQLGGAIGTLAVMGEKGPAVAQRLAGILDLTPPQGNWHTQRDNWVRLGLEVAVLTGSLGKIGKDLSLMSQGEVGELAEPSGKGRGGSSAMPHKRNPVSAMIALAAAARTPQKAATLLATLPQEHERSLGNWQAELAEWPGLFLSAHGSISALREAFSGLLVDPARMRRNIDNLQGLIFAEAVSVYLAQAIGRPAAHHLMEELTGKTLAENRQLADVVCEAVQNSPDLAGKIEIETLQGLFDPVKASISAQQLATTRLSELRQQLHA